MKKHINVYYQITKEKELEIDISKLADTLIKECPKEYDSDDMADEFYLNMEFFLKDFGLPEGSTLDDYQQDDIYYEVVDDLIYRIEEILQK